jgi:hypothetical protein
MTRSVVKLKVAMIWYSHSTKPKKPKNMNRALGVES